MRAYKFRGKSDNDWVYGFLMRVDDIDQAEHETFDYFIQTNNVRYEEYEKFYITDNDTIGQYTGIDDKDGTEIYEGDRVYIISEDEEAVVEWDSDSAKFIIVQDDIVTDFDFWYGADLEVVGDIYDRK